jgi:thioredoxin 1
MIVDLTEATYGDYIQSRELVLVDFFAQWCPPCQKFMLVFPRLEEALKDLPVGLAKVDIDANKSLSTNMNIEKVPTFVIYKNGVEIDRWSGIKTIADIEAKLRTA